MFTEFTVTGETKMKFGNKPIFEFRAGVYNECSVVLLQFYLFEIGFSAVIALKTKYRSQLNTDRRLIEALTII